MLTLKWVWIWIIFISKDGTEDASNDGSGDDGLATGNISVINMTSAECILKVK